MRKITYIALFTAISLSAGAMQESNFICNKENPIIQEKITSIAKEDVRIFLISKMKEINISFNLESLKFDIDYTAPHADFYLTTYFQATLGSELALKSYYTVQDNIGNNIHPDEFHGLAFFYDVNEEIKKDHQGTPLFKTCELRYTGYSLIDYVIVHKGIDNWHIDQGNDTAIFYSLYRYKVSL